MIVFFCRFSFYTGQFYRIQLNLCTTVTIQTHLIETVTFHKLDKVDMLLRQTLKNALYFADVAF